MNITVTLDLANADQPAKSGPVAIGWFAPEGAPAPERVSFRGGNKTHAKSASRCPGVVQLESRYFLIRCPFDLNVTFGRDDAGNPVFLDAAPDAPIAFLPQSQWRSASIPTVQLSLPYRFVTDEVCYLTQLDSFAHYRPNALPGIIVAERHSIHNWVHPINWTFEWHDTGKPLQIKQGDPLFYCQFETDGPDRPVQVVRVEQTDEIRTWMDQMTTAAQFAAQTRALLQATQSARPAQLLGSRIR